MPTLPPIELGLEGVRIEPQPMFGNPAGGVLHLLSGGETNPAWFGGGIKDVYAFFSAPGTEGRGGHYHPVLDECFFTLSGTALWVLSDFRDGSPTKGKTAACILGWNKPADAHGVPMHTYETHGGIGRLRVPAGVYHAVFPLGTGFVAAALGTTGFDKNDYRYPAPEDVPELKAILDQFGLTMEDVKRNEKA